MLKYYSINSPFTINGTDYYEDSEICTYNTESDIMAILGLKYVGDDKFNKELIIIEDFSYAHNVQELIDSQILIPIVNKSKQINSIKFT